MTASIISTVVATAAKVKQILSALVPTATLEQLAIDAIPRPVESLVYNAGVHISAALEYAINDIQGIVHLIPSGALVNLLTLLTSIKAEIDGVLVPPAGSALLKLVPKIVTLVQAYIASFATGSPATQAVLQQMIAVAATEAPAAVPSSATQEVTQ